MEEKNPIILPPKYYLDYFKYVLDFVSDKYEHILSGEEQDFINSFYQLSEDAQCLFVRITIRKGIYFRVHKFDYKEILDISQAEKDLLQNNFIISSSDYPDVTGADLFRIFTKAELYQHITDFADLDINKSIKRTELEELILDNLSENEIIDLFGTKNQVVVQGYQEEWAITRLLFFGNSYGDMSDFVIRDVGNARFQQFDESKFSPSFETREELLAVWDMRLYRQELKVLEELGDPGMIYDWIQSVDLKYYLEIEKSRSGTEKLINKVGYMLEQSKMFDEALEIFQLTDATPSRERQVRIHKKTGNIAAATDLARQILEAPNSAKEQYFAHDFIKREESKIKSTTQRQKNGIVVEIDESHKYRVENGVAEFYISQGFNAIHSENYIWKSLFGLAFWEIIFDQNHSSIHQPLQRRPSDLSGKDFYNRRRNDIDDFLSSIKSKKVFIKMIEQRFEEYEGSVNPFVFWHSELRTVLEVLMHRLNLRQLKAVIKEISLDPTVKSSGFPDLMVWNDSEYYFYEVKSPTDQLSEKQLFWIEFFDRIKINAEIILVQWK